MQIVGITLINMQLTHRYIAEQNVESSGNCLDNPGYKSISLVLHQQLGALAERKAYWKPRMEALIRVLHCFHFGVIEYWSWCLSY